MVRPNQDGPGIRSKRSPLRVVAFWSMVGLCVVAIWTGLFAFLWFDQRSTLAMAKTTAANLARVFAEQTARGVDQVDRTLRTMAYLLGSDSYTNLRLEAQRQSLLSEQIMLLLYAGADGHVIQTSSAGGTGNVDISDREYFPLHQNDAALGMHVARPQVGRITGRWSITMSRRVERNGQFAGVVLAAVDPAWFQRFFETLDVGNHGVVLLARDDGAILARTGMTPDVLSGNINAARLAEQVRREGNGVTMLDSPIDGVRRMVAFRRVEGTRLFVSISFAETEVLDRLHARHRWLAGGATLLTLVLLALGWSVQRASRREEQSLDAAGRAEQRLLRVLDNMGEGFVLFDPSGALELCNQRYRAMLGPAGKHAVPGTRANAFLRAVYDEGVMDLREQSPQEWVRTRLNPPSNGEPVIYQQHLANGRWLLCSDKRTEDGSIVGLRMDISDLKQRESELTDTRQQVERQSTELRETAGKLRMAKQQAELANAARGAFLAHMSHELRTPLNAIIGFADLIRHRAGEQPKLGEYAVHIHDSGHHLLTLINDLLDISKIDAGKLDLSPTLLDPRTIADSCRGMMEGLADAAQQVLSVELQPDCPPLYADERSVKQMLINLLSNAIKFTPPGGRIELVFSGMQDGGVRAEVIDTGIGMTEAEISVALEPFGQIRNAGLIAGRGTGLGLPLVERLIRLHGGRLTIDSVPQKGTRIALIFPPQR